SWKSRAGGAPWRLNKKCITTGPSISSFLPLFQFRFLTKATAVLPVKPLIAFAIIGEDRAIGKQDLLGEFPSFGKSLLAENSAVQMPLDLRAVEQTISEMTFGLFRPLFKP